MNAIKSNFVKYIKYITCLPVSLFSAVLLQCVCSSFPLFSRDRCSVIVLCVLVSRWHNRFTSLDPRLALAFCFSCEQAFCLNLVLSSLGLPLGLQWAFIWNKERKRIQPKSVFVLHFYNACAVLMLLNQFYSKYFIFCHCITVYYSCLSLSLHYY